MGSHPSDNSNFLRRLLDILPIPVTYVDSELVYRLCNKAAASALGRPVEDIIGRSLDEVVAEHPVIINAVTHVVRTGEPFEETIVYSSDTEPELQRHWMVAYHPDRDESGRIVGVITQGLDVTDLVTMGKQLSDELKEREDAEEALRESEWRLSQERAVLRAIAENTEAHLAYLDPDFNFVWVNAAYAVAGRRPSEEFIGLNHFDLYPNEENAAIFRKVRETGEPAVFRAKPFAHPDQPERGMTYWDWTFMPVRDNDGKLQGFVLSLTDVTDLKQSEEALKDAYKRERHISEVLQRAIVPATPSIGDGYPTAAVYIPAFADEEVGGDFYDVFRLEDGRVGILIGDVSGKGVEAASHGAATRSTIRALAYTSASPGQALTHANEVLRAHQVSAQFVTAHLSFLDQDTGCVSYASAGHLPPAILRANGDVEFMIVGNVPLGVLAGHRFREGDYCLDLGDTMVLYTDGVTEARGDGTLFGFEGIMRVIPGCAGKPPECVCSTLLAEVKAFARGTLRDDTAIVVVQRQSQS